MRVGLLPGSAALDELQLSYKFIGLSLASIEWRLDHVAKRGGHFDGLGLAGLDGGVEPTRELRSQQPTKDQDSCPSAAGHAATSSYRALKSISTTGARPEKSIVAISSRVSSRSCSASMSAYSASAS